MRINQPTPSISSSPSPSKVEASNGIVRLNKQVQTPSKVVTPANKVVTPVNTAPKSTVKVPAAPVARPQVVTRETYVERYHDSGVMGNPFFWMWMSENNNSRQYAPQQPTQVMVKSVDGETVKVSPDQMIVRKYSYNPVREFFVFALGAGVATLVVRKLSI